MANTGDNMMVTHPGLPKQSIPTSQHVAPKVGEDLPNPSTENVSNLSVNEVQEDGYHWWKSSPQDVLDMQRLGKHQEFKRNFGGWSTFGFVSIYMATWEYVLVSLSTGFVNGGFAGLFWTFIGTVICYTTIVLSLAEMESMAPTSGGQYHWTSEFAPASCQKWLSYASGWMSSLGWIASVSSGAFVSATLVQAMIDIVQGSGHVLTSWQYTLIMLAFLSASIVFNSWLAGILPAVQTFALWIHIGGWALTIMALLVTNIGRFNDSKEVFLHVTSNSGWGNVGVACLISQVSVIYCNLGSDSIVHISEEVPNASLIIPRCMLWSYIGNVISGILMLAVMLFCIGPLDAVLDSDAPYIVLFLNTQLIGLAAFLTIVLSVLIFIGNITALATASRELWAFSRDHGLPFSEWISVVDSDRNIPVNAVYLTSVLAGVLCFVNMGSTLAFELIISLCLLGILSTYMLSIGCLIHRRLFGEKLPVARWTLGRFGLPVNIFAFFYCAFIIIFACLPTELPVESPSNANWAPLVWLAVIAWSVGEYWARGKKKYTPPVQFVQSSGGAHLGSMQPSVTHMDTDEIRSDR